MKYFGQDDLSAVIRVSRRDCLRLAVAGVAKSLRTLRVTEGERVVIKWTTDEAVEVHLHGYDIELQLTPGTTGTMDFAAKATGRYPITAHGFGHRALAYLEVHPR